MGIFRKHRDNNASFTYVVPGPPEGITGFGWEVHLTPSGTGGAWGWSLYDNGIQVGGKATHDMYLAGLPVLPSRRSQDPRCEAIESARQKMIEIKQQRLLVALPRFVRLDEEE